MRSRRRFGLALLACLAFCTTFSFPVLSSAASNSSSQATFTSTSSLRISAFNIQVLGPSKASNPFVMRTLAQILKRYDMTFVQEIRDSDRTAIDTLLAKLNAESPRTYALALSERLGRSVSKEQYAFIYDPQRIQLLDVSTYSDRHDEFEREPYLGRFRSGSLDFTLVGIHVTPRAVTAELQALNQVYREVTAQWQDQDLLIMGDLNADCAYYDASLGFSFFDEQPFELIPSGTDTTVAPAVCTYDRVLAFGAIVQHLRQGKAYNFQAAFGLSLDEARSISDHYPVEFELSTDAGVAVEAPPPTRPHPASASVDSADAASPVTAKSCGQEPYRTPRGYCFATFEQGKRRVAGSCCSEPVSLAPVALSGAEALELE